MLTNTLLREIFCKPRSNWKFESFSKKNMKIIKILLIVRPIAVKRIN